MLVAIDAGHGGEDVGGASLGAPEKQIALSYATALGWELQKRGLRVIQTRTADRFVTLTERARIANDAGADLFLSIHANASDDRTARGPWTIYAAPSAAGREVATAIQAALRHTLGGSLGAVYPDGSPWVGNRRLAVLRQTKMPAVLIELGFMTNPVEVRLLESPVTRRDVVADLADAIVTLNDPPPAVVKPAPVHEPPNLERIIVPTREHFEAAARVRRLDPDKVMGYVALVEAVLRVMVLTGVKAVKPAADVLADVIKEDG